MSFERLIGLTILPRGVGTFRFDMHAAYTLRGVEVDTTGDRSRLALTRFACTPKVVTAVIRSFHDHGVWVAVTIKGMEFPEVPA